MSTPEERAKYVTEAKERLASKSPRDRRDIDYRYERTRYESLDRKRPKL